MTRLFAPRLLLLLLLLALAVTAMPAPVAAQQPQPVPALKARVTDLSGTLDAQSVARMEAKLAAFEARKGSQIVVLMVNSTAPETIEEYSMRVAEAWKIGRGRLDKGGPSVDDGLILVVAKADRRLRFEVGYGLEGVIPDARARQIIDQFITPRFRDGDFAGGIEAGLDAAIKLIDGEPLPAPRPRAQAQQSDFGEALLASLLGAFFVALILRQMFGRALGSAAGGLVGGSIVGSAAGLLMGVGAGVGLFLFLALLAGSGMGQVGRHTWRSGPGGGFPFPGGFGGRGGGGGFGGGGGGGGFGGGGGGFGGGGASGSW